MHEEDFNKVVEGFYTEDDKNQEEFSLGLGQAAFLDYVDNPELYTDRDVEGIIEHMRAADRAWRNKYNQEILELHGD